MSSTQALSSAAQDRKARLAQLKSLKRKQPEDDIKRDRDFDATLQDAVQSENSQTNQLQGAEQLPTTTEDVTTRYLSGRNYDTTTRNAKLGFEQAPNAGVETLEMRAEALSNETKQEAAKAAQSDAPLDLFALQPRRPNWDLKRDLQAKLDILNTRTDNAIARLVRERIASQKARVDSEGNGRKPGGFGSEVEGDGPVALLEGAALVEATNVREREDEEEARREREAEEALLDAR